MASSSSKVNENNNNGDGESSRVIRVWSPRDKSAADEYPVAPRPELRFRPSQDSLVRQLKNVGLQSSTAYPIRTDAENCRLFLRTGSCSFGSHCRYNHPMLAKNRDPNERLISGTEKERDEAVPVSGTKKIECKYHLRLRGCKFGESCRFHHSQSLPKLNFLGLPIRPNEKVCPFYWRNGTCGFGTACSFNHPPLTTRGESHKPCYGGQATNSTRVSSPWVAGGRQQPYHNHISGQSTLRCPPMMVNSVPYMGYHYPNMDATNQSPLMAVYYQVPAFSQNKKAEPAREIPAGRPKTSDLSEQPGREAKLMAELKTPAPRREPCALNEVGLPLRPGEKICWNYENLGLCKSGRACAYDHPPGLRAPAIIRESVSRCYLGETVRNPAPEPS